MTTGLLPSCCQRAIGYQHFYQHFASSGPHTEARYSLKPTAFHSSPFQANSREEVVAPSAQIMEICVRTGFQRITSPYHQAVR